MTVQGVDISSWQDSNSTPQFNDFVKMRQAGAQFAFIRACYGRSKDSDFDANWSGAKEAGIARGAYMFLVWSSAPESQAEYLWSIIKNDPGEMPPVIDFEWVPGEDEPSDAILRLYKCITHLELLCGRRPIIYTSYGFFDDPTFKASVGTDYYNEIGTYPLWVADYTDPVDLPRAWARYTFRQYSSHGEGPKYGVESGNIDLDEFAGTIEEFNKFISSGELEVHSMWENNALIASFEPFANVPEVEDIDFAALKAAGITAVILTCGYPDNFLNPDDPSAAFRDNLQYKLWFNAAKAAGLRILIQYPFTAMLDAVNSNDGSVTMRYLNYLLSGGYKPAKGGGLLLDLESNTWLEGGDRKVKTCTSTNYKDDLGAVFGKIWDTFRLVPGIRTGRWFLDYRDEGGTSIVSQLGFLDQGEAQVPFFLARYRLSGSLVTGDFHGAVVNVPDPSLSEVVLNKGTAQERRVNEQAYYLYFGNRTKWMGYDVGTVRHSAVKDANGNNALFRLTIWNGTPEQFDTYFNFETATEDPGDGGTGDPEPDPGVINKINQRLDAIEATLNRIKAALDSILKNW